MGDWQLPAGSVVQAYGCTWVKRRKALKRIPRAPKTKLDFLENGHKKFEDL
jgi:hypothetical protein